MRTSSLLIFVVLAITFSTKSFADTLFLPNMAFRQYCPSYCWLGSTPRIEEVIHSRCPGGINNTRPCTRFRNENVEGRRLEGRTCNCGSTPVPVSNTPSPSPGAIVTPIPGTKFPTTTSTTYFPPIAIPTTYDSAECGNIVISGASTEKSFKISTGANYGAVTLYWQFYSIADRAIVSYNGKDVFDTGMESYDGMNTVEYLGTETFVTVTMFSPSLDSAWDFLMTCA